MKVANIAYFIWKTYTNIVGLEIIREHINDDNAYCLVLIIYIMD